MYWKHANSVHIVLYRTEYLFFEFRKDFHIYHLPIQSAAWKRVQYGEKCMKEILTLSKS